MRPRQFLLLALTAAFAAGHANAMTLGEALQLAAERDPFLDSANGVFAAEAQLGAQERAGLRPSVSFQGQGQQNDTESKFAFGEEKDSFPSWSAYFQARQPIMRMDWSARGDRADLRDALAKEGLDDRHSQFVVRVSKRYVDTLLAEDGVRLAESEATAVS
ncbi:MAG: TolC family protein, partial [Panacagrimonas sp.]